MNNDTQIKALMFVFYGYIVITVVMGLLGIYTQGNNIVSSQDIIYYDYME